MADLENATATKGKEVKKHTMFRAFLDDFEVQQFDLSEESKEELESHRWTIYSLFSIDTILCFTIIGASTHIIPCSFFQTLHMYFGHAFKNAFE